MRQALETNVAKHYGRGGLAKSILEGLEKTGADLDALTPEDLAPVDEFHTAGRVTTVKAFELTPLRAGMHVIDVGCGIGGAARCMAREHRCRVTGVDLTPEYIDVARMLTEMTRLTDVCTFEQASALDLPFDDASFDAGVSFHAAMNIEDRAQFYGELARVLRRGAPLCIFDVMKGPAPGMIYPVPWAETATTSFLKSSAETKSLLEAAGFGIEKEENLRAFAIDYFRKVFETAATAGGPPSLGLHLLTGANAAEKFGNYLKACEAHQIEPVILVAQRR